MKKVLLHNLSVQYASYKDGGFDFDQNGIFFAEAGDVVVTRSKINEAYCLFLKKIALLDDGVRFLFSEKKLRNDPRAIFGDQKLLKKVISVMDSKEQYSLNCFMVTQNEANFAKTIGARLMENPNDYFLWGNKSTFRKFAKKNKFTVPRGFESQKNGFDLLFSMLLLFFLGAREVIIKENEGVAGLGSKRFLRTVVFKELISKKEAPILDFSRAIVPTHSPEFVIEEWYQDTVCSPSIQYYINEGGDVEYISSHLQVFRENRMTYCGCFSRQWIPDGVQDELYETGMKFMELLSKEGVRGNQTLNAIVNKNEKLIWTELNPRRVLSSYPNHIMKKLLGKEAHKYYYVSMQFIKEHWKGKTIDTLLEGLKDHLYSPDTKKGIIPYNYALLFSAGHVSILAISPTREGAGQLISHVASI